MALRWLRSGAAVVGDWTMDPWWNLYPLIIQDLLCESVDYFMMIVPVKPDLSGSPPDI